MNAYTFMILSSILAVAIAGGNAPGGIPLTGLAPYGVLAGVAHYSGPAGVVPYGAAAGLGYYGGRAEPPGIPFAHSYSVQTQHIVPVPAARGYGAWAPGSLGAGAWGNGKWNNGAGLWGPSAYSAWGPSAYNSWNNGLYGRSYAHGTGFGLAANKMSFGIGGAGLYGGYGDYGAYSKYYK